MDLDLAEFYALLAISVVTPYVADFSVANFHTYRTRRTVFPDVAQKRPVRTEFLVYQGNPLRLTALAGFMHFSARRFKPS
ncbi:hypothetical protein JZU51_00190 [bacterium]|nr:hypothetical protein [bacterium]